MNFYQQLYYSLTNQVVKLNHILKNLLTLFFLHLLLLCLLLFWSFFILSRCFQGSFYTLSLEVILCSTILLSECLLLLLSVVLPGILLSYGFIMGKMPRLSWKWLQVWPRCWGRFCNRWCLPWWGRTLNWQLWVKVIS